MLSYRFYIMSLVKSLVFVKIRQLYTLNDLHLSKLDSGLYLEQSADLKFLSDSCSFIIDRTIRNSHQCYIQ